MLLNEAHKGTNYMQEIVANHGQNCFISTPDCVLSNALISSLKKYTEEIQDFIRTEQKRTNVMTSARIQPICRKYNISIGCFDGRRIKPRKIIGRKKALKMHNESLLFNLEIK